MSETHSSDGRTWRIGELAAATGLTVRTLHHYEALGLLAPSARTDGGHRLYGDADVERLYRVRVLRSLGLSLAEIAATIDTGAGLAEVLRAHLARVEEEVERLTRLRERLRGLCADAGAVTGADLVATVDAMSWLERHVRERSASVVDRRDIEQRWRDVGDTLRACMDAGEDPAAVRPQAAAREAQALIDAFTGGDRAAQERLARLRAVGPPRDHAGWDPPLTRYLDAALAARTTKG
jgi:DNA-binding transcriptional MerR regulator